MPPKLAVSSHCFISQVTSRGTRFIIYFKSHRFYFIIIWHTLCSSFRTCSACTRPSATLTWTNYEFIAKLRKMICWEEIQKGSGRRLCPSQQRRTPKDPVSPTDTSEVFPIAILLPWFLKHHTEAFLCFGQGDISGEYRSNTLGKRLILLFFPPMWVHHF